MLNALNAFPSPECLVLKHSCLQLDRRLLPFPVPNGFSVLNPLRFLLNVGMQGKGLFVFLLCCTGPEIGRFLLDDLNVAGDYKK